LAVELGVSRDRIDTIIDFAAAHEYGATTLLCSLSWPR
jgi:hypothetical protein